MRSLRENDCCSDESRSRRTLVTRMRPEEVIDVDAVRVVGDTDGRLEWECDLVSEEQGLIERFRVWVHADDAPRLPRPAAAADKWMQNQVSDMVQGQSFPTLQQSAPVRLRP